MKLFKQSIIAYTEQEAPPVPEIWKGYKMVPDTFEIKVIQFGSD